MFLNFQSTRIAVTINMYNCDNIIYLKSFKTIEQQMEI